MKSYSAVYNKSKQEVLNRRKAIIESQKVSIINVLKEEYMITGKISDLSKKEQTLMMERLLTYWNPKNGINNAGIKLLNENMITLTPNSSKDEIKMYIVKQTKRNLQQITESFKTNNMDLVVESFKEEIEPVIKKRLKNEFVLNTVWDIVSNRIKMGL